MPVSCQVSSPPGRSRASVPQQLSRLLPTPPATCPGYQKKRGWRDGSLTWELFLSSLSYTWKKSWAEVLVPNGGEEGPDALQEGGSWRWCRWVEDGLCPTRGIEN